MTNVTALRWLVRRLLGSPAGLFSVTKFSADFKSQAISVGREHLYEFLSHLEDAFLLQTIPVATDSEKRRQVNPRRVRHVGEDCAGAGQFLHPERAATSASRGVH